MALVVTIIVLIILAGVSINLLLGQNGILIKAKQGSRNAEEAKAREKVELALLELQGDKETNIKYNETTFIDEVIQNNGMKINQDRVFTDGWKFQIDRTKLQIVANLGKGEAETIEIAPSYIGTTSFTVKIGYSYQEEEIETYRFYIDDTEMKTTLEKEYTKEQLEAESIHRVKVIANYKDGKTIESNTLTVKTEPRIYLYNNGDRCIDITGDWKTMLVDNGAKDTQIKEVNLTFHNDRMNIKIQQTDATFESGSVAINHSIDYSQYKSLHIIYTGSLTDYSGANTIRLCKNHEKIISHTYNEIATLCYKNEIKQKTEYVLDLSSMKDFNSFYIYLQAAKASKIANIDIYEVWLEK